MLDNPATEQDVVPEASLFSAAAFLPFPFTLVQPPPALIIQGAEALVYKTHFIDPDTLAALKVRPSKPYRHPILDARLTKQRVLAEARVLVKLAGVADVNVPGVLSVEWDLARKVKGLSANSQGGKGGGAWLLMEWIDGQSLKDVMRGWDNWYRSESRTSDERRQGEYHLKRLLRRVGSTIGKMHGIGGVVHGDLTSSNIMIRPDDATHGVLNSWAAPLDGEIVLIDFGLASQAVQDEDRAVDLYVLERAFGSTHPMQEHWFDEEVLQSQEGYRGSFKGSNVVLKRLDEVRLRGRKRSMIG